MSRGDEGAPANEDDSKEEEAAGAVEPVGGVAEFVQGFLVAVAFVGGEVCVRACDPF